MDQSVSSPLSESPPPLLKEVALLQADSLAGLVGVLFHASKCEVGVRFTGRDNTLFDRVLLPSAIFFEFRKPIHYLPMRSEVVTAARYSGPASIKDLIFSSQNYLW